MSSIDVLPRLLRRFFSSFSFSFSFSSSPSSSSSCEEILSFEELLACSFTLLPYTANSNSPGTSASSSSSSSSIPSLSNTSRNRLCSFSNISQSGSHTDLLSFLNDMAFDVNAFNESSHTRIEFCSRLEDLQPPPRKTDESFTIRFNVKYTSIEFSCDAMLLLSLFLSSSSLSSPSSLKNASKTFNRRTEIQSTLRNPNGGSYSSVTVSLFFSFSFAAFVVASPSTTTLATLAAAAVVPRLLMICFYFSRRAFISVK